MRSIGILRVCEDKPKWTAPRSWRTNPPGNRCDSTIQFFLRSPSEITPIWPVPWNKATFPPFPVSCGYIRRNSSGSPFIAIEFGLPNRPGLLKVGDRCGEFFTDDESRPAMLSLTGFTIRDPYRSAKSQTSGSVTHCYLRVRGAQPAMAGRKEHDQRWRRNPVPHHQGRGTMPWELAPGSIPHAHLTGAPGKNRERTC